MTAADLCVSVLTVVRNDAQGLERTITSIGKARTASRYSIQHVVVDGASTDGTREVILAHQSTIDRWLSEPDGGIYDAMNKAAHLAKPSSLLIWINAGDELLELNGLLDAFAGPVDALFCAVRLPNGAVLAPAIYTPCTERNIFPRTVFRHQGFIIRRESFFALGGYRLDVGSQADGLLMSQTVQRLKWISTPTPAAIFRLDGFSNTRHASVLESYIKVVKAMELSLLRTLWFQRAYIAKMCLKILLPRRLNALIMRLRWGSS